ncbi:VQ motif-containing protein 10-like [Carica papaya]|uniref:VQ motif-containing protein 10-like n=1 Tax=Carica papaya TaxID=3649 RepID=UPI000B8C9B42|nr:VQ motif-containing protein 10-like [Carica papaya]
MARQDGFKVKLIDTHYVETDLRSFKSVVQSLTGKDASVKWMEESSFSAKNSYKKAKAGMAPGNVSDHRHQHHRSVDLVGGSVSVSNHAMSINREFDDRMNLEGIPMEELQWLWSK